MKSSTSIKAFGCATCGLIGPACHGPHSTPCPGRPVRLTLHGSRTAEHAALDFVGLLAHTCRTRWLVSAELSDDGVHVVTEPEPVVEVEEPGGVFRIGWG